MDRLRTLDLLRERGLSKPRNDAPKAFRYNGIQKDFCAKE
jgi:hypothetical protein